MLFMVIERFHPLKMKEIYKRVEERGRMLPDGVIYINSWVDEQISTCFQVMESDSENKIHQWISHWSDLIDFEVIRVLSSDQAKEKALKA